MLFDLLFSHGDLEGTRSAKLARLSSILQRVAAGVKRHELDTEYHAQVISPDRPGRAVFESVLDSVLDSFDSALDSVLVNHHIGLCEHENPEHIAPGLPYDLANACVVQA